MNVGEKIVKLREARNITTNKLANISGISQSYLRELELGKKNPTIEILTYICDALGVTLRDFFTDEDTDIDPGLITSIRKLTTDEQIKLAVFLNTLKEK